MDWRRWKMGNRGAEKRWAERNSLQRINGKPAKVDRALAFDPGECRANVITAGPRGQMHQVIEAQLMEPNASMGEEPFDNPEEALDVDAKPHLLLHLAQERLTGRFQQFRTAPRQGPECFGVQLMQ